MSGASIQVDYEGFKKLVAEFTKAAPTADQAGLDNGFKCLNLAYLGLDLVQGSPEQIMSVSAWEYAARRHGERDRELFLAELRKQRA